MSHMHPATARCDAAHTMVRIDQTQAQCALEHACPPSRSCPLGGRFANIHAANRDSLSSSSTEWKVTSAPNFLDL